jgi:CheY-like chemotaxis protein
MSTHATDCCLVVDDNPDVLRIMGLMVSGMADIRVCCCASAAEALHQFATAPCSVRFVITDLDMPEMDGQALCRRLHELDPGMKVVLATGSDSFDERDNTQLGFFGVLRKPFPIEALRSVVSALVA